MPTDPMALASAIDPSIYLPQLQASQRQQIAQLLLQQGLTPMSGTESVGGVAIRRSPMEGVAKLGALLSGESQQDQANQMQLGVYQRQMQALQSPGGFGLTQPAEQPSQGQALGAALAGQLAGQPAGQTTPAGAMGLPGMSPMESMRTYLTNPDKYMDAYIKGYTPNETTIGARQAGVDPVMANRLALIKAQTAPGVLESQQAGLSPSEIRAAALTKAIKDAEISRRPKEAFSNPMTGEAGMVGAIPEGANVTGSPGPHGEVSIAPMPGNTRVLAANSAATTRGTNTETPTTAYDADGRPIFSTKAQDVDRAGFNPAAPVKFSVTDPGTARAQLARIPDPQERARVLSEFDKQFSAVPGATPEQRPGVVEGAKNAQDTMNTSYKAVSAANAPAQTIQARFSTIAQLAGIAITGGDTEWRDKANNLLQLAGISDRAVDRKTAGDLIDKNAAQISLALGSGSTGTDSLRALASAANPSRHMTPKAIQEAVEQLSASAKVQQAKATLLTPIYNQGIPSKYIAAEKSFDQAADYRLFQLHDMNKEQVQAFRDSVLKQPDGAAQWRALQTKAAELKQLGVF